MTTSGGVVPHKATDEAGGSLLFNDVPRFYTLYEEKEMETLLKRITFDKDILCGKPLIRGLRISVDMILELLAKGATEKEILEDYPDLELDDIRAVLLYAHHMIAKEDDYIRTTA